MNCPTLRVYCLPLHSPAYLDLNTSPSNGPGEPLVGGGTKTGQLLRSSLAGNSASGRKHPLSRSLSYPLREQPWIAHKTGYSRASQE